MIVLSPCFYPDASYADLMVESASRNGLKVELFGIGQQFIPHGAHAQVFQLCTLMKQKKLDDYALITDCRDVLFLAGEKEIMEKFKLCSSPILMSTERGCWPPNPEVIEAFHGKSPYGFDYINAGQYIGQWDHIVECLDFLLRAYRPGSDLDNSQAWWPLAKARGELKFALDYDCSIFQAMSGGADSHVRVSRNRAFNDLTNTYPCSVHFNGNPGVDRPHAPLFKEIFR